MENSAEEKSSILEERCIWYRNGDEEKNFSDDCIFIRACIPLQTSKLISESPANQKRFSP